METSISLFDEIKKGGYESSIITTFNAYLPFYEEVLLRKLSSNGVRHNVLMMDSAQCQRCFNNQPPYLAGRRYTLLPMQSNGVFHPKIILLLGKKKGLLAVGSHNLTLSGFGENRELTNVIRFSGDDKDDSIIIFNQVLKSLYNWVKYLDGSIPDNLIQMLHKAESYAPWLDSNHLIPSDEISIIATEPEGNSLWSQLKTKINGPISRIVVGSAFFDSKLAFLNCLINELRPNQLYIGIDPATVMAPPELASLKDAIVVNTSNIKSEESTESAASKYLHAKFIVIENTEGVKFLVSGSANASAPAWLGSGASQNTEMMLVRSDDDTASTIKSLGLLNVIDCPQIELQEWDLLSEKWGQKEASVSGAPSMGVATCINDMITFSLKANALGPIECVLLDDLGVALDAVSLRPNGRKIEIRRESLSLNSVSRVNVFFNDEHESSFFVHHDAEVKEQLRTPNQNKFRDALSSLSFASPDLETFLACVDRIIFSKSERVNAYKKEVAIHNANNEADNPPNTSGFGIDLSETKKVKTANRLIVKDDLAYLLDVLLFHLKIQKSDLRTYDSVNSQGRNEEEGVGAEDNEIEVDNDLPEERAIEILQACHKKMESLVSRMSKNLVEFKKGNLDIEEVIVKLLGVLAVIRELRNCDNTQSWVVKGKTTVPLDVRQKLLTSILDNLFEGEHSIWQLERNNPEILLTDDMTKLKGLMIWLIWDCDATFSIQEKFGESKEAKLKRIIFNSWVLTAGQLLDKDNKIMGQAMESIGPLCKDDLTWVKNLGRFNEKLAEIIERGEVPETVKKAKEGDIAFHATLSHLPLRLVDSSSYGDFIAMQTHDSKKPTIKFMKDKVNIIPSETFLETFR